MHREASLPVEFEELRASVQFVARKSQHEYSGSCPECGGTIHPDGSWPDRFVMWTTSKLGKPNGWCMKCGYKWWAGMAAGKQLTAEERQRWIEEREEAERAAREAAECRYQSALRVLSMERMWEKYHAQLNDDTRKLWRIRGIPDVWQDYWQLGFCGDFRVWVEADRREHHTSSLAIPIFEPGKVDWNVVSLRHRLLFPPSPNDKYRPEMSGLLPAPFMCDPDEGYKHQRIIIFEGEIKAAVAYLELDTAHHQVLGVPGKNCWRELAPKLAGKQVWLCFDPDAQQQAHEFAQLITGAEFVRVMSIPEKVDDAILSGWLDKSDMVRLLTAARMMK